MSTYLKIKLTIKTESVWQRVFGGIGTKLIDNRSKNKIKTENISV